MVFFRRWLFNLWYFQRPPWDSGISPPELMEFIRSSQPGRALDLGCGTGTNIITLAKNGWQVTGVEDGQEYLFKLRAACGSKFSKWTHEQTCVPGAVTGSGLGSLAMIPIGLLVRMVARSLWSVIRARLRINYR